MYISYLSSYFSSSSSYYHCHFIYSFIYFFFFFFLGGGYDVNIGQGVRRRPGGVAGVVAVNVIRATLCGIPPGLSTLMTV